MAFGLGWRAMVSVVAFGVLAAFISGFVASMPGNAWLPENKYYGFPLVWRTYDPSYGEGHHYFELAVDCIFWISMVWIMAVSARISRGCTEKKRPETAVSGEKDPESTEEKQNVS